MTVTVEEIEALVATSYSPNMIPKLEEYVVACCEGKVDYIFAAVRTLVKLYQLFPPSSTGDESGSSSVPAAATIKSSRYTHIGYACFLALLQYPNTNDLLALSYMIPPTITLKEASPYVFKCSENFKQCHFVEFWKVYESLKNSVDPIVKQLATSSVGRVQEAILSVLALSYKTAPLAVVKKACNTDDLDTLAKNSTVIESVTADSVVFKATPDNTKRQRVYQEGVSFNAISSLLNKMAQ